MMSCAHLNMGLRWRFLTPCNQTSRRNINAKLCPSNRGMLRLAGGLAAHCVAQCERLAEFDLIIVPGWPLHKSISAELAAALHKAHQSGARFMTICSGIFLLSRIGLTQGHTITTHWQFIAQLKAETSSETIEENVLYCRDRQIMSSAGSAAGIDLGLEIARQDYGTETANRMAQRLVLPAHRAGGQKQFVPRPIAAPQKGQLAAYLDHVRQKLDEPWPIKKLANLCHMSERTLMRRFQEIVGLSPKPMAEPGTNLFRSLAVGKRPLYDG